MIFHQWQDHDSKAYTYLVGCKSKGEAVLIDPVLEHMAFYVKFLAQHNLNLMYACETHVHTDHLTASFNLRQELGCSLVHGVHAPVESDVVRLDESSVLSVGLFSLSCIETPGHTDHDVTYVVNDRLFTGDSLLIQGCGRTDFQSGSAKKQWHSVTEKLFQWPDETLIYPGHDYHQRRVSCIGEEKALNPRFAEKNYDDFEQIMKILKLDPPKMIATALPFNMQGTPSPSGGQRVNMTLS